MVQLVPAPHRAKSSASRVVVWVSASVCTIFTIVDLKSLLVKVHKVPQSVRSNAKALSPGWVPQFCSFRLQDTLVSSLPFGVLYPLDLPFDLPLDFLSGHWRPEG